MYFSTIKEIIINKPGCLKSYLRDLMPLYFSQASSDNEAIRNIVAESIGKLFITYPLDIGPTLKQAFTNVGSELGMQITCTKSFKYSAHSGTEQAHFQPFVDILLMKISATDLALKEYALDSIGQIAYNPHLSDLLQPHTDQIVKLTLEETPVKKDLIQTIDLGPFKHTVDHGVPIRKSAFNLLQNLLNRYPTNQTEIIDAVISGFGDSNDDVQMLCFGFMNKLIVSCPMIVISKLDQIVEKFNLFYSKISPKFKSGS
jgi:cullin-associated NEDD8-dissociated protein 1